MQFPIDFGWIFLRFGMDFSSILDGFFWIVHRLWMEFSMDFLYFVPSMLDCFSDQYYIDFLTILGGFSHTFGVDFSIDFGWVFQTILHVLLIDSLSIFHRFWVDLSIDFELICP